MLYALVGNQNCGKTTLFNSLTGSDQHIGNFPGVTVEQKTGSLRQNSDIRITDLPGIYSIRPFSTEETVTRDFVLSKKTDGIINILDASNIERNMYLTLQLLELGLPMIIVLNMMDEVKNNGGDIDTETLSDRLGVPVLSVAAAKNEGIPELINKLCALSEKPVPPRRVPVYSTQEIQKCLESVCDMIRAKAEAVGFSPRFCASKIMEGDSWFIRRLEIDPIDAERIENRICMTEKKTGFDRNTALASARYAFIEKLCAETVIPCRLSKEHLHSEKADKILTGKYTALPCFCLILFSVCYLTFHVIGRALSDLLTLGIDRLSVQTAVLLDHWGINPVLHSLVIDGIFTGVGSVLGFLPIIAVLFFFLSVLEDSGYMARAAFILDKPLRRFGLSGKSFVPLLIGFGCSVPAVMAARTLPSERERKMTVLLTPYMSCSAKIPVYTVFASAFFKGREAFVMMAIYLLGIGIGFVFSILVKTEQGNIDSSGFILELPNYRMPSAKNTGRLILKRSKDFLQKAFGIILVASVIIWFLQTFDANMKITDNKADCLLSYAGRLLLPIFRPLGFNDWRIPTSLLAGFTAKEAVISTMSVLFNVNTSKLSAILPGCFTSASALSFLIFTLLYTPCAAATAAIKRELASGFKAFFVVLFQCVLAWCVSFLFYTLCSVFGFFTE